MYMKKHETIKRRGNKEDRDKEEEIAVKRVVVLNAEDRQTTGVERDMTDVTETMMEDKGIRTTDADFRTGATTDAMERIATGAITTHVVMTIEAKAETDTAHTGEPTTAEEIITE